MLAVLQKGKEWGGSGGLESKMEMNSHLCAQIKAAELFNFLPLLDLQKRRERGESRGDLGGWISLSGSSACFSSSMLLFWPVLQYIDWKVHLYKSVCSCFWLGWPEKIPKIWLHHLPIHLSKGLLTLFLTLLTFSGSNTPGVAKLRPAGNIWHDSLDSPALRWLIELPRSCHDVDCIHLNLSCNACFSPLG